MLLQDQYVTGIFFIHSFHHKILFRSSIKDSQGQIKGCSPLQLVSKTSKNRNFRILFVHFWPPFLALLDPDPYSQYGSGSKKSKQIRIRIQGAKWIWIHMDPDPRHWSYRTNIISPKRIKHGHKVITCSLREIDPLLHANCRQSPWRRPTAHCEIFLRWCRTP